MPSKKATGDSGYITSYIGLGSNLDQPAQQLLQAFEQLAELPGSQLCSRSSLYRSAPLGPAPQDDYINAVAELSTSLPAQQLLIELQAIERRHGRIRNRRWTPRTLDLDILLYGQFVIDEPNLRIPHAEMFQRNFVLCPLLEIAPQLVLPDNTRLVERLAQCPAGRLVKLPAGSSSTASHKPG
ncbi:MAG: 2-amino-4-hydroxy-6-hydroxymethyldihydropteridine diphosphokinase [Gammaproteobacteria bacterium]|nr:2-amino-4-hydroxy-6-hydroxymethyldihydropteridine diphosphokinase [Gammaproteobacteria bacterium]